MAEFVRSPDAMETWLVRSSPDVMCHGQLKISQEEATSSGQEQAENQRVVEIDLKRRESCLESSAVLC